MRHGEAEPLRGSDADRALVAAGVADAATVAREIAERLGPVALVAASPYVRAQQTAGIVCDRLSPPRIETWPELVPSTTVEPVIESLKAEHDVLLVTHQPLISYLFEWLTGQSRGIGTTNALAINVETLQPGWGELECAITP